METPHALEQRFWQHTERRGNNECWPWTGPANSKGYGQLQVARHKRRAATRFSWELKNGKPFPADKLACHRCDNPRCVNPAHIWPGTPRDNHNDAVAKGRRQTSSLSADDVRHIKEIYEPRCPTNGAKALASRFGLHPCTVARAANGRSDSIGGQLSALNRAWNRASSEARSAFLRGIAESSQ